MDTTHYKERLEKEKRELETQLSTVGRKREGENDWEAVQFDPGQEADQGDQAERIASYEDNVAILADLEARYREVMAALDRIESGSYGRCTVNGEPIEKARLDADPAAAVCSSHRSS